MTSTTRDCVSKDVKCIGCSGTREWPFPMWQAAYLSPEEWLLGLPCVPEYDSQSTLLKLQEEDKQFELHGLAILYDPSSFPPPSNPSTQHGGSPPCLSSFLDQLCEHFNRAMLTGHLDERELLHNVLSPTHFSFGENVGMRVLRSPFAVVAWQLVNWWATACAHWDAPYILTPTNHSKFKILD